MKRQVTLVATLLMVVFVALLSGCGEVEYANLAEYVDAHPDITASLEEVTSAAGTDDVTSDVAFNKNRCTITFQYKDTLDSDVAKALSSAFEDQSSVFQEACSSAIADFKENTDFKKISIKIVFLNGDNSEIWSKVYKE